MLVCVGLTVGCLPAGPQQQKAQPCQIGRACKLQHPVQGGHLPHDRPAGNRQADIQGIAQGDAKANKQRAAQPMPHGMANNEKKIRAGAEQGQKVRQRKGRKSGGNQCGNRHGWPPCGQHTLFLFARIVRM